MDLRVEAGSTSHGSCTCCGGTTTTVTGFLSTAEAAVAAYFVSWTVGAVASHGAAFDFVIGSWGDGTAAADRVAVSLLLRLVDGKPQFMVRDAESRPAASSTLASRALARNDVIGTPLAARVFELVDAVWLRDTRIAELTAAREARASGGLAKRPRGA